MMGLGLNALVAQVNAATGGRLSPMAVAAKLVNLAGPEGSPEREALYERRSELLAAARAAMAPEPSREPPARRARPQSPAQALRRAADALDRAEECLDWLEDEIPTRFEGVLEATRAAAKEAHAAADAAGAA